MKSQFYHVKNPRRTVDNGEWLDQYIYHSKKPRFMAEIKRMGSNIHELFVESEPLSQVFFYLNPDGIIECIQLIVRDVFDKADDEKILSKLKRACDWYANYIQWQDSQLGDAKTGKLQFLTDYNDKLPGLKVLYCENAPQPWSIIYKGIARSFENEFDMDNFLAEKFNINIDDLDEGTINTINW